MKYIDKILGESEDDPLSKFLHLLRTILGFDIYEGDLSDYDQLAPEVMRQARQIDGLLESEVWLTIEDYLDFTESVVKLPHDVHRLRHEEWAMVHRQDLAYRVIRAINSGQFSPPKDMVQSMLGGDPFQERYNFDSVTPANEGYLQQIVDIFGGEPWSTPQNVIDEMNNL